ncbi:hypothetical protein HK096_002204 [Nowakowskiella sp. JEL0078]|nr:hypothetical protein HK096_002204 [Nowakowskiella sp. JEL0078]
MASINEVIIFDILKLLLQFGRSQWVQWSTAAFCILMISTQFQYLFKVTKITPDDLGRCLQSGDPLPETFHLLGDFVVRIVLSGLFVYANLEHSSQIKDINIRERLFRLIKNDFRASFIDIVALSVKLITAFSNLPSSQSRFLIHFMDFAKAAGTHWFVMDIANGTLKSTGSENSSDQYESRYYSQAAELSHLGTSRASTYVVNSPASLHSHSRQMSNVSASTYFYPNSAFAQSPESYRGG